MLHLDQQTSNWKSTVITWGNSDYCIQPHASSGSSYSEHIIDSLIFHLLVEIAFDVLKNCDWKLESQAFRLRLWYSFDIC